MTVFLYKGIIISWSPACPISGALGFGVFMRPARKRRLQGLKPPSFGRLYVVAEATTHKPFRVVIRAEETG